MFFIKYLRQLGFEADNGLFAEHSWYFRNALVRANYNNIKKGIYETTEFLERFLCNLLQNEKNELYNREMHISGLFVGKSENDPINDLISDPINDPIKNKAGEREQRILDLMKTEPGITHAKMAEIIGCSQSTVKRTIQAMASKNMVRRIGSNKKGEWIIM